MAALSVMTIFESATTLTNLPPALAVMLTSPATMVPLISMLLPSSTTFSPRTSMIAPSLMTSLFLPSTSVAVLMSRLDSGRYLPSLLVTFRSLMSLAGIITL